MFLKEPSGNPYQIETCLQLQQIAEDTSLLPLHYVLNNDVECGPDGGTGNDTHIWNADPAEWENGTVGGTLIPDEYNTNYPNRVANVTNNGYQGFVPIGTDQDPFTGTFDGQGHSIDDVWIFRKNTNYVGVFGSTVGANISNVSLENANIVGSSYSGGIVGAGSNTTISSVKSIDSMVRAYLAFNGGGIAGYLDGSSITDAEVQTGSVHGSGNIIGGLVGIMNASTITHATSSASADGGTFIGGAVGDMSGSELVDVHASGHVIGTVAEPVKQGTYIGGLVGRAYSNSTIEDSSASGDVSNVSDNSGISGYFGGFVGILINGSVVRRSFATGNVNAEYYVGGFAGFNEGTIEDSYARGNVTGTANGIGGFVGSNVNTIEYSYAVGTVEATGQGYSAVGGFAGDNQGTINNAFTTGDVVVPDASPNVGLFAGSNTSNIVAGVYKVSGSLPGVGSGDDSIVTSVTNASALQSTTTNSVFQPWNFTDTWSYFCDGYPDLKWKSGASVACTEVTETPITNTARHSSRSQTRHHLTVATAIAPVTVTVPTTTVATTTCSTNLYPTQPIKFGAQNDPVQVKVLQEYLNTYEHANLPVTGIYSVQDRDAVIKWQEKHAKEILEPWNLTKGTGYIYTTSLKKLREDFLSQCSGPSVSNTVRDLQSTMTGEDVQSLQKLLIAQGYSIPAGPTGYFAQQTRNALIKYQTDKGIVPATGSFGADTRTFMKSAGLSGLWW